MASSSQPVIRIEITASHVHVGKTAVASVIARALNEALPFTTVEVESQDGDFARRYNAPERSDLDAITRDTVKIVLADNNGNPALSGQCSKIYTISCGKAVTLDGSGVSPQLNGGTATSQPSDSEKIEKGITWMMACVDAMASIRSYPEKPSLHITIDPNDKDPAATLEFLKNEYAKRMSAN